MTFVSNYDADTIKVNIAGVPPLFGDKMAVRVAGVDSPELKSKNACERDLAIKARNFVRDRPQTARRIDLRNAKDDKYFRILANVVYYGRSLATNFLRENLAVPYDGVTKQMVN